MSNQFSSPITLAQISQNCDGLSTAYPTTLFVHGLDSSSRTWVGVMSSLTSPSVAVDLRGSGTSPLGETDAFSRENVVRDLKKVVEEHDLLHGNGDIKRRPFVLVGHSLGGRVVMSYASKYPEDVAALVIEDMDIGVRKIESSPVRTLDANKVQGFQREFDSKDGAISSLTNVGYKIEMIERWLADGRIREMPNGNYWSDVNPEFRLLCYRAFLDSGSGEAAWEDIASQSSAIASFPCHLMVAGVDGTVCDAQSVKRMQDIMGRKRLTVHEYPDAGHSIHNTARDEYMATLNNIIQGVVAAQSN